MHASLAIDSILLIKRQTKHTKQKKKEPVVEVEVNETIYRKQEIEMLKHVTCLVFFIFLSVS